MVKGSLIYCAHKLFRRTNISYPLIHTLTCGKKCKFFGKFYVRTKLMIPNCFQPLTIFAKTSILDNWHKVFEYAYDSRENISRPNLSSLGVLWECLVRLFLFPWLIFSICHIIFLIQKRNRTKASFGHF